MTDTRSPRWTMWIALASLLVVIPLVGWAELRAYEGAHGGPPPGPEAFLLWCIGFGT